jgi:predicted esterase
MECAPWKSAHPDRRFAGRAKRTLIKLYGCATAEAFSRSTGSSPSRHWRHSRPKPAGSWYPSRSWRRSKRSAVLDSALGRVESIVEDLLARGIASDRIALLGFSQGACLASEFTARRPRRYAAIIALTGGLIGPPGTPRDYAGSLQGTPVFLGTSDPDPHVPFERVRETETVLTKMGAAVELRRYAGMPHTINQDELEASRALLRRVVSGERDGR